jgi:hypothetical protein
MLPDTFRQSLVPLQEAILRSAAARASSPVHSFRVAPTPPQSTDASRAPTREAPAATGLHGGDKIVQEIGSRLFEFIFQRTILDLYNQSYRDARRHQTPLLIRLCVEHPDLSFVPWETLYDKDNRFYLATSHYTPFARGVNSGDDEGSLASEGPIRILGMAARVKTLNGIALDAIEVDAEQLLMKKALANVDDGRTMRLCWIPSARTRDLNRTLARGDGGKRWDIFHFIGHGGHDRARGMGYIVVQEDGSTKGTRLYSEDLRNFLIQPDRTPALVVLNSCSGAQAQPGDLFSSTATDLILGGIPAVVAMQFEISDNMGIAFSEAFYTYLAVEHFPLQRALTSARADLKASGYSEWISPVLYMRSPDGELFKNVAADTPVSQESRS